METEVDYYDLAMQESLKADAKLDKVYSLLEKALDQGDADAAYMLGNWFMHGKHVEKNLRKATTLMRYAARNNVPAALYDMAVSYEKGNGVKKDARLAMEHYLRATIYGNQQAFHAVGRCYYCGVGVDENKRLARIWFKRAKELDEEILGRNQ